MFFSYCDRSHDLLMPRSTLSRKRDIGENRDFRMGNRVPGKREKKKRRKKKRRKEDKKKGQRTIRSQRFKRRLLMATLEQESTYDTVDAAAILPIRYRVAGSPSKFASGNAKRRGSRAINGSRIDPGRAQIRGGQDCTDGGHPANIDAAKYLESAHCLRFSDLW